MILSSTAKRTSAARGSCRLVAVLCICTVLLLTGCETKEVNSSDEKSITVRGVLVQVAAIGGETTGWALDLEKPITVEGRELRRIEINGKAERWNKFADKRVEAAGKIAFREGIERGLYPVLEVESMKEVEP